MKRRKRGGNSHWCWCCDRHLANERFSGRNHGRHLCKECSRLPLIERQYRQAILEIDRIYYRPGKFKKKKPKIERFLEHADEQVRVYAAAMLRDPDRIIDDLWEPEDELLPELDIDNGPPAPPWSVYERERFVQEEHEPVWDGPDVWMPDLEEAVLSEGADGRRVRVRVVGLVFENERLLVVEHQQDGARWWCFPGGTLEPGETPEEGVARELYEELGLVCEVGSLLAVGYYIDAAEHSVELYYRCIASEELVLRDPIVASAVLVDPAQLPELGVFPREIAFDLAKLGTEALAPIRYYGRFA